MIDIGDFGTGPPAGGAPARRRAVRWTTVRARSGGHAWLRTGKRRYHAARHEPVFRLPAGLYTLERDPVDGIVLERRDIRVDALVRFPGSTADTILAEVEHFWTLAPTFAGHGFLHRRGYLLYGAPGCGKTSIVQQVIADVIARDGVVFLCQAPPVLAHGLAVFRRLEPERPLVCVFEDVDAMVQGYGEEDLLALLDGEVQIDHVLNVATTNYPEHLDRRFVARPRRFDRVIRIDPPDAETRRHYLAAKLGADDAELERWVAATDGLSLAACAEAVISVRCLGHGLERTVELLRMTGRGRVSSRESVAGVGFGRG